jgi:hypothetical protein
MGSKTPADWSLTLLSMPCYLVFLHKLRMSFLMKKYLIEVEEEKE